MAAKIDSLLATSTLVGTTFVVVSAEVQASQELDFTATIAYELDGAPYSRELRAGSCEALAAATALIVATVIDPEAVARAQAAFGDAAPAEPAPVATTRPEPPKPQESQLPPKSQAAPRFEARSSSVPIGGSLGALSWGGLGVLPEVAWGAGIIATVSRGPFSVAGDFQYWGEQLRIVDQSTGAGATFIRYGGGLRGCYRLLPGRFSTGACAGLELFAVRGRGYAITEPRGGAPAWLAPVVGLSAQLELTRRLQLVARLEASLPFATHHFDVLGLGRVWDLPPVAGRAGLGAAVAF